MTFKAFRLLGILCAAWVTLYIGATSAWAQDWDPENLNYVPERTFRKISFGQLSLGDPDAPITMIEYASTTCPHCANFNNNVLPGLKERFIKTGQLRIVLRNYILNPYDLYAAMTARCLGPDKLLSFHEYLFRTQHDWLHGNIVANLARMAQEEGGLSRDDFDACLTNQNLMNDIIEMQKYASEQLGVTGTPTFFINGIEVKGPNTVDHFAAIINDYLNPAN